MTSGRKLALCGLALAAGSVAALAQTEVISARSGLVHYIEGQVYVNGRQVQDKLGTFPEVKENQELKTGEGRAEVLLTPGVFLRVGENSSFRMITNRLIDTRLEFLSGSAVIEADDVGKDNSVTVVSGDSAVHVLKKGIYRFDSGPADLRVYDGEAEVTAGDKHVVVKEGHLIALDTLAEQKFDKNITDALNRWSERRAGYVSMANVSAANSLRNSMFYGGFGGGLMFSSGWYWNPYFGMYTFVPGMEGDFFSPYGYQFWSPYNVYMAYMPGYYYTPGYAYGGGGGRAGRYTGAYNTVATHSVPVPARAGGVFRGGYGGSVAVAHGPSGGYSGAASSGSVSVGRVSAGPAPAPISRGGGSVGSHR